MKTLRERSPVDLAHDGVDAGDDGYAVGFFDTYQLWIGDGTNETSFYSSYEVNQDADVATIGVPIAYYPAGSNTGSKAFLQMTYAPSTGTIASTRSRPHPARNDHHRLRGGATMRRPTKIAPAV